MYQLNAFRQSPVASSLRTFGGRKSFARFCFLAANALMWTSIVAQEPRTPLSTTSNNCSTLQRRLPPQGREIPVAQRMAWQTHLADLTKRIQQLPQEHQADVAILTKACQFAIEFREFYRDKDFGKVDRLLRLADQRLKELDTPSGKSTDGKTGSTTKPSWQQLSGLQVRGFFSRVDGAPQPIGLVIPENVADSQQPVPLYVWLHGRGDKVTDLHFICDRLDKQGQITPPGAIVVHPFGRQCIGYKSAGETDVLEAIDFVCEHYPVDPQRIVLMGFSMGGAGVWHLAAHYTDRFVAASPGAGFAETARYQRLKPDQFPVMYEQLLWRVYDVPGYTRNLFNLPVVAYSGENDKQIQAARVMEEAFVAEGRTLTHLIGPGMGHKYHPDTLKQILTKMAAAAEQGRPTAPDSLELHTHHLRYSSRRWLHVDGFVEPYADTRVRAARSDNQNAKASWAITTRNVRRLVIDSTLAGAPQTAVSLDGQILSLRSQSLNRFQAGQGGWDPVPEFRPLRKRPGLSGPIDDAFLDSFVVIPPDTTATDDPVDQWVQCELDTFRERWQSVFRGTLREATSDQLPTAELGNHHLILWGTPTSNPMIARLLAQSGPNSLPLKWTAKSLTVGQQQFAAAAHVPVLVFPNPLAPDKYVVLNSGPTFRSAHDRTNSLQNPHLPDWAVLSLDTPRSEESPGRVVQAGFFDDSWQLATQLQW